MKILIANDGSQFGTAAVDFAVNLIDCSGEMEIKVVMVVEPATTLEVDSIIESVEDLTDPANPLARRAAEVGESSARRLREKCAAANVDVSSEVLGGTAARAIVERAEEWGADLIVVGSHGYGFWKRAWLGSVSDRVAHHAPCSVLIVRNPEP